jgi:hypothetical protein
MRCTETFLPLRVRIVFGMLAALSLVSVCAAKDYLTITSSPSGATVEIDGIIVGKTPYKAEVPSAYYKVSRIRSGCHGTDGKSVCRSNAADSGEVDAASSSSCQTMA